MRRARYRQLAWLGALLFGTAFWCGVASAVAWMCRQ